MFPHITIPPLSLPEECWECARRVCITADAACPPSEVRATDDGAVADYFSHTEYAFVVLGEYPIELPLFHRFREELVGREFVFSPAIRRAAADFLSDVAAGSANAGAGAVFVGVHVRRTDYEDWLRKRLSRDLLDETYFFRAVEILRDKLALDGGRHHEHVIFVVASDDVDWCREKLGGLKGTVAFAADYHARVAPDVSDPAHFDLAVLSQCNHSVFDYGTFGFWGAYLAGGRAVMAGMDNERHFLERRIREANLSATWTILEV